MPETELHEEFYRKKSSSDYYRKYPALGLANRGHYAEASQVANN